MAKGKASSSDSLAPPHTRSLRSRKREHSGEKIPKTDDVQIAVGHQCTEQNNPAVDAAPLQSHQSPLQESTGISTHQHQAAEQSCLTKQDPVTEEKHAEAANVCLENVKIQAFEEREETVTHPNADSQLESFRVHTGNDAKKNKEEISAEGSERPSSPTCTDQLQVFSPASEDRDAAAVGEQLENSQCNMESYQEMSQKESFSSVSLSDVKDVTKEAAVGLPAKKKRRMGMCGLTEKERSHFLQMQKRDNGQSGQETVEKYVCNYTADPVAPEEIISSPPSLPIPAGSVTDEAEIKLLSSPCGGDDRTETEAPIAVTTSDGIVCDPSCLKGNSGEAEGGLVSALEQTDHTKSDPPAEEDEEELVGNQEQQEMEGQTAETMPENPQEQRADEEDEDESAVVGQSPDITSVCSNPTGKETEKQMMSEAAVQQVNSVTRTAEERRVELTGDAGHGDGAEAGASSTDTRSGGFSSGSVELCGAAVAPSGSQTKDSSDRDDEPADGRPAANAELHQNGDTSDPFESGYSDYVSDSQLNTILLTEEEVMEREEDLASADTHEDATDLICGLIRELSSLNRMVMATHRDLENLRRSSKSSRSSVR